MAASLSRPDPSSPASVAEAGFSTSRRGFHQDEVRAFLTSVAAELGRLQERERQLEAELRTTEVVAPEAPDLDEDTVAALLGEETLRVLQTARESASQIKIRAEESAAQTLREAIDEVNRVRQEAEVESARKRHDASSDAEAEVALAKQQGREMVNEARAYRERVLADLERRTKLARQQIEDLLNGRDRLLQVFERARLVAVDVTSELQSIDGPSEHVNFSPTTGPLPVMVPAAELESSSANETTDDTTDDPADGLTDELTDDAGDDTRDDVEPAFDEHPADEPTGDEASAEAVTPATPPRDANVVSLFRDRGVEATDDDDADDIDLIDAEEHGERADVDGIFERLRSEAPDPAADPDAAADTEPDAADADETDDDATDTETVATDTDETNADETAVEPTPFSRRDEALVPLIVSGARKLKRVLADEQNGVLDRLRQKQAVTRLSDLVADLDEHAQRYIDAFADELLDAAVAGAGEVGKNDTKTLRTTLQRGGALSGAHAIVRDDLVGPLRGRLERAITDGDGDSEDITKRVRAVYREWKTQHIDDQLDDAFRFAHGGGMAAGVKPGTSMTWIIDATAPTCPDCEDNSLAGEVTSGEPYPTGHVAAPAHAGCRCLTVPSGQ